MRSRRVLDEESGSLPLKHGHGDDPWGSQRALLARRGGSLDVPITTKSMLAGAFWRGGRAPREGRFHGRGRVLTWEPGALDAAQGRVEGFNAWIDAENARLEAEIEACLAVIAEMEADWEEEKARRRQRRRAESFRRRAEQWGTLTATHEDVESAVPGCALERRASCGFNPRMLADGSLRDVVEPPELRAQRAELRAIRAGRRRRLPSIKEALGEMDDRLGSARLAVPRADVVAALLNALLAMEGQGGGEAADRARQVLGKVEGLARAQPQCSVCVIC
ncbi:unnamed protein product [Ostreobium quekettii]|uniref:Uncharacterized protein n=1 Tax=Ostreobium quekettii TaxID=121088 RepID=A0A8S1JDT0_9CHLO|nr:unnamed protein product [Ostreobium quekettii]|eukprot:evm.model.scf_845.3 EVM.evm.TU.scf_845.3   scf_845:21643-22476(-)